VRSSRAAVALQREAEFSELFRALYPQAYRVAFRLLGNPAAAEDAAAEAFARTFAAWDKVRELPHRDAWVMKTTGHVALNVLARKPTPLAPARAVADEDATATRLALVSALACLSRRQQEAIVLHHLAGFSELEVAEALGVAPSTVKTHLKRGMELLRDDFDIEGASGAA
jgi:RNA polymerase sigma-70 factor (ECF subfamily)